MDEYRRLCVPAKFEVKPKMVSPKQRRRMRAGINAEVRRYRRCLNLVANISVDVVDAGMELFESEAALALWLCEPARALGGAMPMQVAQTRRGAKLVTQILHAISHGVYL